MKKSNRSAQPNESGSATVKAAWIGALGLILTTLITVGPSFFSSSDHAGREIIIKNNDFSKEEFKAELEKSIEKSFKKAQIPLLFEALASLKGQLPEEQIKKAEASLSEGKTEEAEKAFDQIIEKGAGSIALAAYHSGQLAEDRIDYNKAMRQYKKAVVLDDQNPDYLFAAGKMANMLGDYSFAQQWLEQLIKIRQSKQGLDKKQNNINLAVALNTLASLYQDQGKYAQAEYLYKHSLEIKEKTQGKVDHPSVAATLDNLANSYQAQGKYIKAEPLYKRSLEITEKALGKDHPSVSTTLNNLAGLYHAQGKYAQAEPLYKRSLEIKEKALGKDHPSVATTLNNLAVLYYHQEKYQAAIPLFKRALAIFKKTFPKGHPNIDIVQVWLISAQVNIKP